MLSFFKKLLFPDDFKCVFCGKDIPDFDKKPFCENCEKNLPWNNKNRCLICDDPINNEAKVCDFCQKNIRFFKEAFCPFLYEGIVRKTILNFKNQNQRYKAKPLAKFLTERILSENVKIDLVTFVPMTKKKQSERSFNQSELLAQELSKSLKAEFVDLFIKTKETKSQKELSYKERQENVSKAFAFKKNSTLSKNETVLIVDDCLTTCATLNSCAKLIYKKVNCVYVCALARKSLK